MKINTNYSNYNFHRILPGYRQQGRTPQNILGGRGRKNKLISIIIILHYIPMYLFLQSRETKKNFFS